MVASRHTGGSGPVVLHMSGHMHPISSESVAQSKIHDTISGIVCVKPIKPLRVNVCQ
jgi:hypothetical protein